MAELLTTAEAADVVGIARASLHYHIIREHIHYHIQREGKRGGYLFKKSEVNRFISKRKQVLSGKADW